MHTTPRPCRPPTPLVRPTALHAAPTLVLTPASPTCKPPPTCNWPLGLGIARRGSVVCRRRAARTRSVSGAHPHFTGPRPFTQAVSPSFFIAPLNCTLAPGGCTHTAQCCLSGLGRGSWAGHGPWGWGACTCAVCKPIARTYSNALASGPDLDFCVVRCLS